MVSLLRRSPAPALALLMLLPAAAAAQVAAPERPLRDMRSDDPARPQAPEDPAAIRAIDRLSDRLGDQAVVDIDARTGTPRMVARLDGYLTGTSGADAEQVVFDYLRSQLPAFGLSGDDLASLRLVRRYVGPGGITYLQWAQVWRGIAAFDNGLEAAVTADGRLLSLSGSPLPGLAARTSEPALSAEQALQRALGGGVPPRRESQAGPDRRTTFTGGHDARLVLFAGRAGDVHLAWRVTARADEDEIYDTVVDAATGDVLFRDNEVDFVDGTVRAFAAYPTGSAPPSQTVPVDNGNRLFGPTAHVYADLNGNDAVNGAAEEIEATTGTNWPAVFSDRCAPNLCAWTGAANSWQPNLDHSGAQLYYFVDLFHDWLEGAPFGFTAASGAFEGDDRVKGQTMFAANDGGDGLPSRTNNAFMASRKDGQSPTMSMFLWTAPGRHRDSSDDPSIVFHEYTHGLSNRLITDSAGEGALDSPQAEAMGEGWSDWYALDYLVEHGHETDDPSDPGGLELGHYANGGNGIRRQATDCPVGAADTRCDFGGPGGYTYGDFGRVATFTNEHTNGELWTQTLWDLRGRIGAAAARRVITDGMRLTPDNPSMLEARNAILQAATVAGVDRTDVWQVFAARGMGYFAFSQTGFDAAPRESFATPGPGTGVSGRVTDASTGAPVAGAIVRLAASATGFPGDLTGTTDANGNYRIESVPPGTYPRPMVDAAGYSPGFAPDVDVPSGGRALDLQLVRNWASAAGGASVQASDPPAFSECPAAGAIDGSLVSGWGSSAHDVLDGTSLPEGVKSITVALPRAIDVSAFNVDPAETCGDDSSAATGRYRIETSRDGTSFTEVAGGQFTTANNHRANVVPAPAGTADVRFVRYTMLAPQSQGTGQSGRLFMDTTEFEVYGAPPAPPASTAPNAPSTSTLVPDTSGGGIAAIDRTAPRASRFALVARQKLRIALVKGLRLAVECNEPCSARISAQLDARTARRIGLLPRRSRARSLRVAIGTLRMGQGQRTATLEFISDARRLLKRRRSIKLSLRATFTDRSGNSGVRTTSVRVRR